MAILLKDDFHFDEHMDHRWFVVPIYTPYGNPKSGAEVHDRRGQLVAVFEELRHAELVVALHNGALGDE